MDRPREHVIEKESKRYVHNVLPAEWIIRDENPDYGLDYEIEIVKANKVSGKRIYAQIKGTDHIKKVGNDITFSCEKKHLLYWLNCQLPVIFILYDTNECVAYWCFIQEYIYEILDTQKPDWRNQGTATIKINPENLLKTSFDQLTNIANDGVYYLLQKNISPYEWSKKFNLKFNEEDIPEYYVNNADGEWHTIEGAYPYDLIDKHSTDGNTEYIRTTDDEMCMIFK